MKIFQLLPYYFPLHPGGLEKVAQTLTTGLQNTSGYAITTVVSDISSHQKNIDITPNDDSVIFLSSYDIISGFPVPKFRKKDFWKKMKFIRDEKPDVILTHTRFFLSSMIGGILAKISGSKRIHIEHGSGFVTGYPWYIKMGAWIADLTIGLRIFRHCDVIITISEAHKEFIGKFTKKEIIVIYNPVDFSPQPKIQNTIPHIGFVGRLVSLKGVDLLIDTLSELKDIGWQCTIVGAGSERENLENQTNNLGLQDRVHFVGADDRSNRLHRFDVFVNPSWQEGVPTTVVEALMAKCIVVATDVGGTREITDSDDLILVQKGNSQELKLGVEKALNMFNKKGASYEVVMNKFGVKRSIERYKNFICDQ